MTHSNDVESKPCIIQTLESRQHDISLGDYINNPAAQDVKCLRTTDRSVCELKSASV